MTFLNIPLNLPKINNLGSLDWLSGLSFSQPKTVLKKGGLEDWDRFGVRDPALLMDESGNLVKDSGALIMYYTGSPDGVWQGVGRAISFDEGLSWKKEPEHPVLEPIKGGWDYPMAATAWVIKDKDDIYRMYYQGGQSETGTAAIGLAKSMDGINFERIGQAPILTTHDFSGLRKPPFAAMGVINIARTFMGQYLLTFEGLSIKHQGFGQIFGAISEDFESFKPLNNGKPIFTANDVSSWPVKRVCNPRVTSFENEKIYMLAFNGCHDSGMYAIGLAFSDDLKNWKEHPNNPLLCPTGIPINNPFSGRIEGGIIPKEDIVNRKNSIRMFFMAIPHLAKWYGNGVIGMVTGEIDETRFSFKKLTQKKNEIRVKERPQEVLVIKKFYKSLYPPRAIFINKIDENIEKISFEFLLKKGTRNQAALIAFGEELDSAVNREGIKIKFCNGNVYFKAQDRKRNFFQRVLNKLLKLSFGICDWELWFIWQKVSQFQFDQWNSFSIERINKSYRVLVNEKIIGQTGEDYYLLNINSQSLQSMGLEFHVRSIKKWN